MTKEVLQKICSIKNHAMKDPFSYGEHTYATNGHILVRVPRLPDVPEGDFLNEKAAEIFDSIPAALSDMVHLPELPELPEEEAESCKICGGTGTVAVCPECNGEGEITFSTPYSDYEFECLSCYGYGEVEGKGQTCGACHGTGKKLDWRRVPLGASGFAVHYLRLMRGNLPNVKILPSEPRECCYFQFDGGDGFLMPMVEKNRCEHWKA
jgi:hypothetical protein